MREPLSLPAQEWHDDGNTGMDPATNFIGNIDNVPFNFRTYNLRRMQLLETRETNTINGFTNINRTAMLASVGNRACSMASVRSAACI